MSKEVASLDSAATEWEAGEETNQSPETQEAQRERGQARLELETQFPESKHSQEF